MSPSSPRSAGDPAPAPLDRQSAREADGATVSPSSASSCWREIGTFGTRSCQELERWVHCHHCPTFQEAGLRLLRRPVPDTFRREWTERYEKPATQAAPGRNSVLLFQVGAEWLGLATEFLVEITERRRIHSLPQRQTGIVLGLVNIRGELVVCISASRLLGLESAETSQTLRTSHNRLLVTAWHGSRLVFPVDAVHGTERFSSDVLKSLPANVARSTFTQGILDWNQRRVGLLDPGLFFGAAQQNLNPAGLVQ